MPCGRAKKPCTKYGDSCTPLGWAHRPQSHPPAHRAEGHPGAQQRGAGKLSAKAVASRRGCELRPVSEKEGPLGPAGCRPSLRPRRKPAAEGDSAGATASKKLGPGAATGAKRARARRAGGGPLEPAGGEQLQVDIPELPTTPKQEQHRVNSGTGPGGLGQPRGEGPCQPGWVKREEPEGPAQPQAGEPHWPQTIKREEGEASWAEYQEN